MSRPVIVVGVTPWQPDAVLDEAITFALRLQCGILCVSVDVSRREIESRADGSVVAESIDPDSGDVIVEEFDEVLESRIRARSKVAGVECEFLASAGAPARALSRAAEDRDAVMIVVGTRSATFSGTIREFFSGSVAVTLTHRQHRPVLVVPVSPSTGEHVLPWEGDLA